jgi:hypothetical protein
MYPPARIKKNLRSDRPNEKIISSSGNAVSIRLQVCQ